MCCSIRLRFSIRLAALTVRGVEGREIGNGKEEAEMGGRKRQEEEERESEEEAGMG